MELFCMEGVPYRLKAPFDFGFLSRYGRVFRVFDAQDSGNICFGVEQGGRRYFVKFAGAPTAAYDGAPEAAVARLRETAHLYARLTHPNLIPFIRAEEVGGGFAMVFEWVDGDCMGRMYPASHRRFMALPVEARLTVLDDILCFLAYIASAGYVAIDFYDGSILYDARRRKTTVCDIDLFKRQPFVNDMGRLWGSAKFMSPEEFRLGAVIDEVTNVYTAGAMAFALFGAYERSRDAWQLGEAAFRVAARAVSDDRARRQQSIGELKEAWTCALRR